MNTPDPHTSPDVEESSPGESACRRELRELAMAQRQVNVALLLYFCFIPFSIWLAKTGERAPIAAITRVVVVIGLLVFCITSVYRLATIFRGKAIAVIHALGMLIPFLGLILLLINNQKATSILRKNGIRVGLLGADPNSVPSG